MTFPLAARWSLHYDYITNKKTINDTNWLDQVKKITTFESIPQFLYVLDKLEPARKWPISSNIYIFRNNIKPMWEAEENKNGGKWTIEVSRSDDIDLDSLWNKTMALCISENYDNEEICGAVFAPRKNNDRIAIWTKTIDQESIIKIGEMWKNELDLKRPVKFNFFEHGSNKNYKHDRPNKLISL